MKGQTSVLIKGIYLILIFAIIAIVLNRITSANLASIQQEKSLRQRSKANSILEALAGNTNCLAYEEEGRVEGKILELSQHRVLDKKKLDSFSSRFSDIQPDCSRDFNSGYRVEIETFPVDINSVEPKRKGGVFEEILPLIDGKKVVFVLDVSGSMQDQGGKCDIDPINPDTKICCLKLFMNGFIDRMSENSEIAVYPYGDETYCNPQLLFPFTVLDGDITRETLKNRIASLNPYDSTPMAAGLEKGFVYSINNGGQVILLLTDGCENICGSSVYVANKYKNYGIPVYTIAYGTSACTQPLEEIAEITGGRFFDAKTCEELVSKTREVLNVKIPSIYWSFGDLEFSEREALQESITISVPIVVFLDEKTLIPGKMSITLVDGELERLRGFIDKSCLSNTDFQDFFSFHYPVFLEKRNSINFICMEIDKNKICQKLACTKSIYFQGTLTPGHYTIYSNNENDILRVVV